MGNSFYAYSGHLQLCISFHFLLVQSLKVIQRWEIWVSSALHSTRISFWAYMWPSQLLCTLVNFKKPLFPQISPFPASSFRLFILLLFVLNVIRCPRLLWQKLLHSWENWVRKTKRNLCTGPSGEPAKQVEAHSHNFWRIRSIILIQVLAVFISLYVGDGGLAV